MLEEEEGAEAGEGDGDEEGGFVFVSCSLF